MFVTHRQQRFEGLWMGSGLSIQVQRTVIVHHGSAPSKQNGRAQNLYASRLDVHKPSAHKHDMARDNYATLVAVRYTQYKQTIEHKAFVPQDPKHHILLQLFADMAVAPNYKHWVPFVLPVFVLNFQLQDRFLFYK